MEPKRTMPLEHSGTLGTLWLSPLKKWAGGHKMTLYAWAQQAARCPSLPAAEARYFDVAVDARVLAQCNWQRDRTSAPTLLALHGLEGSSEAHYMRGLADKAFAAGFNVVRLNQRNCGGTEHLSRGPLSLGADRGSALRAEGAARSRRPVEIRRRRLLARRQHHDEAGRRARRARVSAGEGVRGGLAGDRARRLHAVDRAAREPHLRVEFLPESAGPHAPEAAGTFRASSIWMGCGKCGRSGRSTIAIPRRTMDTTAPATITIGPARCASSIASRARR